MPKSKKQKLINEEKFKKLIINKSENGIDD